jgi:hypothetical protein
MHRSVPTVLRSFCVATVAVLALGACGDDGEPAASDRSSDTTAAESGDPSTSGTDAERQGGTDASDGHGDTAVGTTGAPTGSLTLDGETWTLTYDAADPNATCQILVGNTAVVSGMRTPDGNRVDVSVQDIPRDNAIATYFADDETPAWSAWTGESSEAPEWSIDGSTVRLSGRWLDRLDPSQPEVDGDLEVTC